MVAQTVRQIVQVMPGRAGRSPSGTVAHVSLVFPSPCTLYMARAVGLGMHKLRTVDQSCRRWTARLMEHRLVPDPSVLRCVGMDVVTLISRAIRLLAPWTVCAIDPHQRQCGQHRLFGYYGSSGTRPASAGTPLPIELTPSDHSPRSGRPLPVRYSRPISVPIKAYSIKPCYCTKQLLPYAPGDPNVAYGSGPVRCSCGRAGRLRLVQPWWTMDCRALTIQHWFDVSGLGSVLHTLEN